MKRLGIFLLMMLSISACGLFDTQGTSTMSEPTIHTDADSLFRWFDLTRFPEPVSVKWVQNATAQPGGNIPSPTDYYVAAVLEYDRPTAQIATELNLATRQDVYVEDAFLDNDWMPDAIISAFGRTPEGYLRFGGTAYSTNNLLVTPLGYGYVLFIDNYILIFGATT